MVCKLVRQQAPFEISLGMFILTEYQHPRKSIYLPFFLKKMSIDSLIQQFTTLSTEYWIQNCNFKKHSQNSKCTKFDRFELGITMDSVFGQCFSFPLLKYLNIHSKKISQLHFKWAKHSTMYLKKHTFTIYSFERIIHCKTA